MLKSFCTGFALVLATSLPITAPLQVAASNAPDEPFNRTDWMLSRQDRYFDGTEIEPLRQIDLPLGDEEVRIWFHRKYSQPSLVRVWQQGGRVDGELIFHWSVGQGDDPPGETNEDLIVHIQAGRCDDFRRRNRGFSCRGVFDREPDWLSIYQRVREKGLWDLPDQVLRRDRISTGGWSILVELRRGDEYRAYSYLNPERQEEFVDDQHALAIANLFRDLFDELAHPYAETFYRGIVPSHLSNVFLPCGSEEPKVMLHWLYDQSWISNHPLPLPSEHGLEVTMRAIPAPDWWAQRLGWAPGLVLLQQIQLESVRPAIGSDGTCSDQPIGPVQSYSEPP